MRFCKECGGMVKDMTPGGRPGVYPYWCGTCRMNRLRGETFRVRDGK